MKRTRSVIPIILATVLCLTAVSPAMGAETAALNSITAEAVAEETDIQDIQMEPDVANIQIVTEDAETQMEIEKSDVREEAEKIHDLLGHSASRQNSLRLVKTKQPMRRSVKIQSEIGDEAQINSIVTIRLIPPEIDIINPKVFDLPLHFPNIVVSKIMGF